VTVADLDRDGTPDVAATTYNSSGYIHIWKGSPSAPGALVDQATPLVGAANPFSVTVADVDRDGWPDVVGSASSTVWYGGDPDLDPLYAYGPGGFSPPLSSALDASLNNAVADLNRDGHMDLFGMWHQDFIRAAFGASNRFFLARFGPPSDLPYIEGYGGFSNPNGHSSTHELADVDKDGHLDLVYAAHLSGRLVILWGRPEASPTNPPELEYGPAAPVELAAPGGLSLPLGARTTDLDGDGRTEILVPENSASAMDLQIFEQVEARERDFATQTPRRWFTGTRVNGFPALVVADVNRDGKQDVVIVGAYGAPSVPGVQVILGR